MVMRISAWNAPHKSTKNHLHFTGALQVLIEYKQHKTNCCSKSDLAGKALEMDKKK